MNEPRIKLPPTIPAKCQKIFQGKIELLPPEAAGVLRAQVGRYLKEVKGKAAGARHLDLPLIERMAQALETLLASYTDLSEEHRALAVGAARYFIETSDANDDLTDPLGFDDDLAVINTVLLVLDRPDLVVTRTR